MNDTMMAMMRYAAESAVATEGTMLERLLEVATSETEKNLPATTSQALKRFEAMLTKRASFKEMVDAAANDSDYDVNLSSHVKT